MERFEKENHDGDDEDVMEDASLPLGKKKRKLKRGTLSKERKKVCTDLDSQCKYGRYDLLQA